MMRTFWLCLVTLLLTGCGAAPEGATSAAPPAEVVSTRQEGLTLPLKAGWNLVGFRCAEVTAIVPDPALAGLAWWDGQVYRTGPVTADQVNRAGVNRGFYLYATQATALSYAGTQREPGARLGIKLEAGWNLVSFPTDVHQVAADHHVLGLENLVAGVPRWLYATQALVLTWSPTPAAPSPSPEAAATPLLATSPSPEAMPVASPTPAPTPSPTPTPVFVAPRLGIDFTALPATVAENEEFTVDVRAYNAGGSLSLMLEVEEAPEGTLLTGVLPQSTDPDTGMARFEGLRLNLAGPVRLRVVATDYTSVSPVVEVTP
jgi:hypothetical protein